MLHSLKSQCMPFHALFVMSTQCTTCTLWTAQLFPVFESRLESSCYAITMIRCLRGLQQPSECCKICMWSVCMCVWHVLDSISWPIPIASYPGGYEATIPIAFRMVSLTYTCLYKPFSVLCYLHMKWPCWAYIVKTTRLYYNPTFSL